MAKNLDIINSLTNTIQKQMENQRNHWYSFFNSSGFLGENFPNSILNYIRMAFFSSALANGKVVYEHRHTDLGNILNKDKLQNLMEVIYSLDGKDFYIDSNHNMFILTINNSIMYIEIAVSYNYNCISLSFDKDFATKFNNKFLELNPKEIKSDI